MAKPAIEPKKIKIAFVLDMTPEGTTIRSGSFTSVKEDTDGPVQSFLVRVNSSKALPSHQLIAWAKCLPEYEHPLEAPTPIEDGLSDVSEALTSDDESFISDEEPYHPSQPKQLDDLPLEILECIAGYLHTDIPAADEGPRRNSDLLAALLTSRRLYSATINVLYQNISIPHSYIFSKMLTQIRTQNHGRRVRRLDFASFTSIGLGRAIADNNSIQNLTSTTLAECLDYTKNLKELVLTEHLQQDLSEEVLFKIFTGLSKLQALDLCGAYTNGFPEAFNLALNRVATLNINIPITRLSLHEAFTVKNSDVRQLISRLPALTVLDVYHTRCDVKTLESIPQTARLTHLNIGQCYNLAGPEVVQFVKKHPSAQDLVWLNTFTDPARHRLFHKTDLDILLPHLSANLQSLRSLNLGGAQINPANHMVHLIKLSSHLEELGLAFSNLEMADIKSFFPPSPTSPSSTPRSHAIDAPIPKPALKYLDLSEVSSVTQPALFFHRCSSRIDTDNPPPIPHLLSSITLPLEVIELNRRCADDMKRMKTSNKRFGWNVHELGRRAWYVRANGNQNCSVESGERWWKYGYRSWGSRKCPVTNAHPSGLLGHHMFA